MLLQSGRALVIMLWTFQCEKRLQACLRKQRQRVHIEEVDNSSDEEESSDSVLPCSKKVSLGHPPG